MALPLVTLQLALPRLPLPYVAYHIHGIANTASAQEPISTSGCSTLATEAYMNAPSNQSHHLSYDNPPTLVRTPSPHVIPPVRMVYDFNPNIHDGKDQEVAPKLDGLIPSSTTSILLASTPPMLPIWSLPDPSGRPLLADCQRSTPSKALKSSKSSQLQSEQCFYCRNEKICGGKTERLVTCRSSSVGVSIQYTVDGSGNERWKANLAHIITDSDFLSRFIKYNKPCHTANCFGAPELARLADESDRLLATTNTTA